MKTLSPSSRAFTLVEVILALAVVSFAVVSLLALLPVGMGTYQQAESTTVETQIAQEIKNQLQNSSYTNLFDTSGSPTTNISDFTNYYDGDGLDTTLGNATNPAVYMATLLTTNNSFTIPGDNGEMPLTNNAGSLAQTVTINITRPQNTNVLFSTSTLIVNKGY